MDAPGRLCRHQFLSTASSNQDDVE